METREQICDAIQSGSVGAYKRLDEYSMIETVIAIGSIPLTPYGTPSTNEVPEATAPYLTEHNVLLLQNHGALTVSPKLFRNRWFSERIKSILKNEKYKGDALLQNHFI